MTKPIAINIPTNGSEAELASAYAEMVLTIFKNMDADPAIVATGLTVLTATMYRGLGLALENATDIVVSSLEDVYAIPVPGDAI